MMYPLIARISHPLYLSIIDLHSKFGVISITQARNASSFFHTMPAARNVLTPSAFFRLRGNREFESGSLQCRASSELVRNPRAEPASRTLTSPAAVEVSGLVCNVAHPCAHPVFVTMPTKPHAVFRATFSPALPATSFATSGIARAKARPGRELTNRGSQRGANLSLARRNSFKSE